MPNEPVRRMTVDISDSIAQRLRLTAVVRGITRRAVIEQALDQYLPPMPDLPAAVRGAATKEGA